jgi:uncharacterized membrane protein (UPF0136 family)
MPIAGMFVVYGLLLMLGGAIGFMKAKSRPSLISGLATGVISLLIALLSRYQLGAALTAGIILGIVLGIFFVNRYAATKKVMPALFMAIVSFLVAAGAIVLTVIRPHTT